MNLRRRIPGKNQVWRRRLARHQSCLRSTSGRIPAGQSAGSFAWTGTNWFGPSDTGNPLGLPFPTGAYDLEVSAIGTADGVDFEVSNTFTVTLTN